MQKHLKISDIVNVLMTKAAVVSMLLLLCAVPAMAQTAMPSNFSFTAGTPTTQGVPILMTWTASTTPNATYAIIGGYPIDNTGIINYVPLAATARSYTQIVPYHVSGTAQPFYGCVLAVLGTVRSENLCAVITVPARPAVVAEIITVEYDEPRTNTDGTVLADLAKTTIYGQVDAGPILNLVTVAAAVPGGGQHKIVSFGAPAVTGDLTVWITATDTSGNESLASVKPPAKKLGMPGKGTISSQTLTQ